MVGFVLLLLVGALYLVSGLIVPLPWLVGLWALWIAAFGVAVARRRQTWYPLAMAAVTAVVWVGAVTLGDAVLDWSA